MSETTDRLQGQLAALKEEQLSLSETVRGAAVTGDGGELAAILARRRILPILIATLEAELAETQVAEIESTLPSLREAAYAARQRGIEARLKVNEARKAADKVGAEGNKAQYSLWAAVESARNLKNQAATLRQSIEQATRKI
jgi:hypothetical protein